MKRDYTMADVRKIKEMAGNHHPQEIANLLGRTKGSILSFAARNGIDVTCSTNKRRTTSDALRVHELREAGKTYKDIGLITGIPASTCCSLHRRRYG